MNSTYRRRIDAGLCVLCGENAPVAGKRMCPLCAEIHRYQSNRQYRKRVAERTARPVGRRQRYEFRAERDGVAVRGTQEDVARFLGVSMSTVYQRAVRKRPTREGVIITRRKITYECA